MKGFTQPTVVTIYPCTCAHYRFLLPFPSTWLSILGFRSQSIPQWLPSGPLAGHTAASISVSAQLGHKLGEWSLSMVCDYMYVCMYQCVCVYVCTYISVCIQPQIF